MKIRRLNILPLYASANDPYGRSFVDSALFHLIMVVGFFKAYKDVLSALVWPNLLLNVDRKVLQEEVKDPTKRQALVTSILAKLKEELRKLKPGSVLAYGSEVKVGGLMSGLNNANLGGVEDFINILQKEIIRGLETNQLLNALNDNVTETRARYEMADFAKLISHTQSTINEAVSRQFNLAFRLKGINETAIFTLNRSIYEEDRLNAEILKTVEDANKAGDDAKMSLLGWLEKGGHGQSHDSTTSRRIFPNRNWSGGTITVRRKCSHEAEMPNTYNAAVECDIHRKREKERKDGKVLQEGATPRCQSDERRR